MQRVLGMSDCEKAARACELRLLQQAAYARNRAALGRALRHMHSPERCRPCTGYTCSPEA